MTLRYCNSLRSHISDCLPAHHRFIHLQAKQVHIVAVGVGQYEDFQGQLEQIAGESVHNVDNFNELSNLFSDILAEACRK